jgi:hypothetical protein
MRALMEQSAKQMDAGALASQLIELHDSLRRVQLFC